MADKSNMYVVSLIAIVAVVGLVTLFTTNGNQAAQGELVQPVDEEGNIAGEAYYLKSGYSRTTPTYRRTAYRSPTRVTYSVPTKAVSEPTGMDRCVNPDSGSDELYTRSNVKFWNDRYKRWQQRGDRCIDSKTLGEWSCLDGVPVFTPRQCFGSCQDGACV